MRVNAVQGADATGTQAAVSSVGQGEDFSSYLQTTASLEEIFSEAAQKYNVPKNLIKAIAKAESDFRPNATSGAGAQGIMQLMPATARELGVTDSYDPYQNIMGGTKYISQMLDKYDGNVSLALAAYNAGSNNVAKYGGIPPFEETQNYVAKVTRFMNEGIDVPGGSYSISAAGQGASVQEVEDSYYQSILDQLFSYEDYLQFIDLYSKIQEAQQEQLKQEQEKQEQEKQDDSYYAYQEMRYSPAVMNLLGLYMSRVLGSMAAEDRRAVLEDFRTLPEKLERVLENREAVQYFASQYFNRDSVFYIGRNIDYALGLEGSLKLKEISYVHSEAYASGELKHGTISLIEDGTLVVALGTYGKLFAKAMSNVVEVKSRGASVLALTTYPHQEEMARTADVVMTIPDIHALLLPILGVVPLQLFAYYVALMRGCDIDKPRNLAKSVTVE